MLKDCIVRLAHCLCWTVVGVLAFHFPPCYANAEESPKITDAELMARLKSIWSGMADAIVTAEIECRYIHRAAAGVHVTRHDVTKVFDTVDLVSRPDDARSISDALGLRIPTTSPAWGTLRLHYEPDGLRQALDFNGKPHNDLIRDKSGDVVRAQFANKQVDVFARGQSRTREIKLEQLRPTLRNVNLEDARIISRLSGQVTLAVDQQTVTADETTGFVSHILTERGPIEVVESSYRYPTEYPGDILFPAEIITTRYRKELLTTVEIMVVQRAQFNTTPRPDALDLAVDSGTKVFDSRNDKNSPAFTRADRPVANVKELVDIRRRPPGASSWSIPRRMFFVGSLGAFAVLFAMWIRRVLTRAVLN